MSEVWFGRGAAQADFDACLNALLLQDRPRAPLLAAITAGPSPRLLLASRALFTLFDATTPDDLLDRLFKSGDPGARRLTALSHALELDGAPRLERLRFLAGPSHHGLTFLCRRVPFAGDPVFVAAILGVDESAVRGDLASGPASEAAHAPSAAPASVETPPRGLEALATALRARWPKGRSQRFLWQCDAAFVLTEISPILHEIVGRPNADLIGRNLLDLAPELDPSGTLAAALARRETWSGIDFDWPIAGQSAAVATTLGAIPIGEREEFGGYRGYGVLYLDRIVDHAERRLAREEPELPPLVAPLQPRTLSPQEQATFAALRGELRVAALDPSALRNDDPAGDAKHKSDPALDKRQDEMARHGLDLIDRLGVGIILARGDVPIFANRHVLESFGFADEDALHAAGGLAYLIVGPARPRSGEATSMRHADGRILPANARMQTMEWDGLPAALLTLQAIGDEAAAPARPVAADDAGEAHELRAILETATDGVAIIDADGNVLSLNRSGEALFGCDRGTVIGRPFASLFAPENQTLASDYLEGLRSSATKQLLNDGREILIKAHRGGTIPVFMTLGRLARSRLGLTALNADAPRFCALFRDLTHWKKVERDLEAARADAERINAVKTECLAKIREDVRGPLKTIVGLAGEIADARFGDLGDARYGEQARQIRETGARMLDLVDGLMAQSDLEQPPLAAPSDVEAVDANKIIRECVGLMQPQASAARIILRLSLAPGLPRVRADAGALRQIALNLLSNAVTFNEPGGQVIVATQIQDSGHVILRIRDTGHGMSDAEISAALEAPGDEAVETSSAGTILSLPITKALVEANDGTLSIRSKVEQGTLVEVAFPPTRVLAG